MKPSGVRALWLLSGLLSAVAAAELFWPDMAGPRPPALLGQVGNTTFLPAADSTKAWTTAILARPLFNSDRRPKESPSQGGAISGRAEPPRLSGILIAPDGARAIFAGVSGERPVVVATGAKLGPWEILAIETGQVRLSGPDGERTIRPSYVNGAATPLPPVSKPQVQAMPLLPPLPQAATQPFESLQQPSGASIFTNAALPPATRTPN
jgi:hypothetical protein